MTIIIIITTIITAWYLTAEKKRTKTEIDLFFGPTSEFIITIETSFLLFFLKRVRSQFHMLSPGTVYC